MVANMALLRLPTQVARPDGDPTDESMQDSARTTAKQICCISCFRLMPEALLSEQLQEIGRQDPCEPELLCSTCVIAMAGKNGASGAAQQTVALSPLPKLSFLVKAEAKCQDQLQMLRSQQEMLRQQRESIQATKRAKEEAAASERELARQRRKHFLAIQERRKREEELKFQQFQADEHSTSRSEQEAARFDNLKKQRPTKSKIDASRKAGSSQEEQPAVLPQVSTPKRTETPVLRTSSDRAAETHSTSFRERRQQMLACYSQDLSPLVHGRKPKRLPFPKPATAALASGVIKRRQSADNNSQLILVANVIRSNTQKSGKSPASKSMKLRPLENQSLKRQLRESPHDNNQFEEGHARQIAPLSLPLPRNVVNCSAPLTAEIKPVSWAYELAKDVLPLDDRGSTVDDLCFHNGLHSVAEEEDTQLLMFPMRHQLPSPTFPPSKALPASSSSTTSAPRWEYSTERLSSLLEKYNVSVSAATAPKQQILDS